MSIRIVTDSTCDLPAEIISRYEISVIPVYINIGEKGYLDGIDITRQDFYQNLPTFKAHPTTAAPGIEMFHNTYEQLVNRGAKQILSIHISQSLSGVMGVAQIAAESYKKAMVKVLDSRQLGIGLGFQVETAARMAQEGKNLNEILAVLEDQIRRTYVFAALETVEFLQRSGRMNWMMAGLASLLKVKPLLKMHDGHPTSERIRTYNNAINRLLVLLKQVTPLERAAIINTNAPDKAEALRAKAAGLLPEGNVPTVGITPVIGAHVGPGVVGFACISRK